MQREILGIPFSIEFNTDPPTEDMESWVLADRRTPGGETVEEYISRSLVLTLREQQIDDDTVQLAFTLRHARGLSFLVNKTVVSFRLSTANLSRIWHLDPQGMTYPGLPISPQGGGNPPPGGFRSFCSAGRSMPIVLAMDPDGFNLLSVGMIDQVPATLIECRGPFARKPPTRSWTVRFDRHIEGTELRVGKYQDVVWVSRKHVSWFDIMQEYTAAVDQASGYQPIPLTERALFGPVWNAALGLFDEHNQEAIWEAAQKAHALGARVISIDVGWDTSLPWGWDRIGDGIPEPERYPDFRALADKIHALGMYVTVNWIPFVIGERSRSFAALKDALIQTEDGPMARRLCPRTLATRDHLVKVAERLVGEFGVDGLWIDELEGVGFRLVDMEGWRYQVNKPCIAPHEHVHATNADGLKACMRAMHDAVTRIKPQAMFINRRPHGNLCNKPFTTHFWPPDNAFDFTMSRRECVFMHSYRRGILIEPYCDCWSPEEPDEHLARRLISQILVGVPTVAFDFDITPERQINIVKTWFGFYNEHFQDLWAGSLRPLVPQSPEYAVLVKSQGAYVGCFELVPGRIPLGRSYDKVYLFNCGRGALTTLLIGQTGRYCYQVFDCRRSPVGSGEVDASGEGVFLNLSTPEPALVELTRI
jgi:hypothetical protein